MTRLTPTDTSVSASLAGMTELREFLRGSVHRMRRAHFPPERVVIEVKALSASLDQLMAHGRPSDVELLRSKELREWMVTCAIEDYYDVAADDLTR